MFDKTDDMIARYKSIWKDFVSANRDFDNNLVNVIIKGESFHNICQLIYGVPYYISKDLFDPSLSDSNKNIGSVTGLFFEHLISYVISKIAKNKFTDIIVESNKCSDFITRKISRDPDLFLKINDYRVVIEFKVSPKKRDIKYILDLKSKYYEQNIGYYFIGGHISLNATELEKLTRNDWMTFFDSSKSNSELLSKFNTVDQIMNKIWDILSGKEWRHVT